MVSKGINATYLTRYPTADSYLFVHPKRCYYLTDFRYVLEAKKYFKGQRGISVIQYQNSFPHTLAQIVESMGVKRLGFEAHDLTFEAFSHIQEAVSSLAKLIPCLRLIEEQRAVKEEKELYYIKKAIDLNLDLFRYIRPYIKKGNSEKDILRRLHRFVERKNVSFSFPPIVASGPNTSYPHARITDRIFQRSDVVLLDVGIDFEGYKSDLTRIFFLGKIPQHIREIYADVCKAQEAAIELIKEGVPAKAVDEQARNILREKQLDRFFGHALGHGVGLEIHESPTLSSKNSSRLKEGMVITVEPAVYIPKEFGIRIEDMVLVTKGGRKVLSRKPIL